jgi:hypothetical protein
MFNAILRADSAIAVLLGALMLCLNVPAHADDLRSTTCVGTRWSQSCVVRWRADAGDAHFIEVPAVSKQGIAGSKLRDQAWQARCQSRMRQDRYGVVRYV